MVCAAGNVLLAGSPAAPNGFSAKVADFGFARCMPGRSRTSISTYGATTHQAPETLELGVMSKVSRPLAFACFAPPDAV